MRAPRQLAAVIIVLVTGLVSAAGAFAAEPVKPHRIAIQVDQDDPKLVNLVLNNVANLTEYYNGKGEDVQIEVVAYGPGLNMLREDKSSVKDRIRHIAEGSFPSQVRFSACNNTKKGMEKAEGHPIQIIPQATIVPAGVARLNDLEEQGWSYIRP